MSRRLSQSLLIAALILAFPARAAADADKILQTRFAVIRYADEQQIGDLLWRITGKRVGLPDSAQLLKNRTDELVGRVEALLEMYPAPFHFTIQLQPHYDGGAIAEYSHRTRSITVAVDRVTDGVLAHEMAHAVINAYFPVPPPEKAQEILAQYVDKHLYNL